MKNFRLLLYFLLLSPCWYSPPVSASDPASVRVKVTVLIASEKGRDMDLINDEYRDQLIKLFSYPSYQEIHAQMLELPKSERVKLALTSGYELLLTYESVESSKTNIQALIRKDSKQYVFTVLSMPAEGAVFLGGPPAEKGVLIIVVETGF